MLDAIVTAGGVPEPGESLYEFSQGRSKALIDVAGKPMAQWVLDALSEAKSVGRVVLVGLDKSDGLTCKKQLSYLPNQGGMLDNIRGGARKIVELNPKSEYALIVSSDIPAVTGEMIGDGAKACVLAHRDELTAQNRAKFQRVVPGISTSVIDATEKSWGGQVAFADFTANGNFGFGHVATSTGAGTGSSPRARAIPNFAAAISASLARQAICFSKNARASAAGISTTSPR